MKDMETFFNETQPLSTANLLLFLQKTRHSEAESWFSRARALAPDDREVHLHYGMFLLDADRSREAAQHFVLAAAASRDSTTAHNEHAYEATFNAALAFRYFTTLT